MSKPLTVEDRSAGPNLTVPVHILGPNLRNQDETFHVHAGECADVRRSRLYFGEDHRVDREETVEVDSLHDVVVGVYLPEEHGYAEEDWRTYASEFKVFPCVVLPDEPIPAPVRVPEPELRLSLGRDQVAALLRYGRIGAIAKDGTRVSLTVTKS